MKKEKKLRRKQRKEIKEKFCHFFLSYNLKRNRANDYTETR